MLNLNAKNLLVVLLFGLLAACAGPVRVGVDCGIIWDNGDVDLDGNCRVPVSLLTLTPTPTVTETLTPTVTQTPTPSVTPTPQAASIPYGPFHNSDFTRTIFNGAIISGQEWERLHEIRDYGYRVFAAAADSNPCAYMVDPNNGDTWDWHGFIDDILVRKSEILAHFADGTVLGLVELNEPHNPTYCEPVPARLLVDAAQAFWANFTELDPGRFYFGFWTQPTYYEDAGVTATGINLAMAQYSNASQPVQEWLAPFEDSATRQGMRLILSANLYRLGAAATGQANVYQCSRPVAVMVTFWSDRYYSDADEPYFRDAATACAR